MRRRGLLPFVLIAAGIELSTRVFTLFAVRLREGIDDLLTGTATATVPTERFMLGTALLAAGLGIAAVQLLRSVSLRKLANGDCPTCGGRTRRIRRKTIHRALGRVLGLGVSRRSCSECGWVGLARDH